MSKFLVTSAVGDHATAWGTTDWSAAGTGSGTGSPHWTTATTGIMNGLANLGMAFGHVYGQISGNSPEYQQTPMHQPEPRKNNTILYLGIALVAIVLFLVFRKK